jgi:hypothetical protein
MKLKIATIQVPLSNTTFDCAQKTYTLKEDMECEFFDVYSKVHRKITVYTNWTVPSLCTDHIIKDMIGINISFEVATDGTVHIR